MHPALEQAILKLYGYTSDAGGIRHALTEESTVPSYGDAKFMLVLKQAKSEASFWPFSAKRTARTLSGSASFCRK